MLHDIEKSQPDAVGGKQGQRECRGAFAAREHGGQKSRGIAKAEDDGGGKKDGCEDGVHALLYARGAQNIIKCLTRMGRGVTIQL